MYHTSTDHEKAEMSTIIFIRKTLSLGIDFIMLKESDKWHINPKGVYIPR